MKIGPAVGVGVSFRRYIDVMSGPVLTLFLSLCIVILIGEENLNF